jgi:hypothetical protein
LHPLNNCFELRKITLQRNQLESIDITPLFYGPYLQSFSFDEGVALEADAALKEEDTNWSDMLVDIYD